MINQPTNKIKEPTRTTGKKRIFFFYNRPIQIRYAITAVLVIFATILTYTFILYHQVSAVIGANQVQNGAEGEAIASLAMQNFVVAIAWGSLACIFVAGGTSAIWAMLITHRYEGPMVRINRHLIELSKGNYDQDVLVRKNDEMKNLVQAVNELTLSLREKHSKR